MARVKNRDTKPELEVRQLLRKLGFYYRLVYKSLPCKPDIIFPGRKKVIFVHGCFWHGHEGCKRFNIPKTNFQFWLLKIEKNKERDRYNIQQMNLLGWDTLVIWQCELNQKDQLSTRLTAFLTT